MTIGLFGGSFNPPHTAHCIVAETVRDQFDLDAIWWIPSHRPPHKEAAGLARSAHRLAMTKLITDEHAAFEASDMEIRREGVSYTVDTLRTVQEQHPDTDFQLILGSDSLRDFGAWHCPEEIVERVPIIVYKRPGAISSVVDPRFANEVRFADAPLLEIAGTEIRARRRKGRSIRYFVPESVHAYIHEHGLYTNGA